MTIKEIRIYMKNVHDTVHQIYTKFKETAHHKGSSQELAVHTQSVKTNVKVNIFVFLTKNIC